MQLDYCVFGFLIAIKIETNELNKINEFNLYV